MTGDCHVRICGSPGVRFPRATRPKSLFAVPPRSFVSALGLDLSARRTGGGDWVSESEAVRALRRKLGRHLATARKDAGYAQREFARRISYARSTLSTVESGVQRAGRVFRETCDGVLRTGGRFAQGYDRIRVRLAVERRDAAGRASAPERASERLRRQADSLDVIGGSNVDLTFPVGMAPCAAPERPVGPPGSQHFRRHFLRRAAGQ